MSLADWMSDADFDWRTRLKQVNLVVETDFSMEEIQEAQAKYGVAAQHLLAKGWTHKELIQRYPAHRGHFGSAPLWT